MKALEKVRVTSSRYLIYLLCFMLALILFSCSGDPGTDDPYGTVTNQPPNTSSNPFSKPSGTAITDLTLIASTDYNTTTDQLTIYVRVIDQNNNIVTTFNEDNFEVTLDNLVISNIDRSFATATSDDSVVGLILDSSGSMTANRITDAVAAANAFIAKMDITTRTDLTAYIDFDSSARIVVPLTTDKTKLQADIATTLVYPASGSTNIGAAISSASFAIGARPGKTAGILLTDGEDNGGVIAEGIANAKRIGLPVFTILMGEDNDLDGLVDGISATARSDMDNITNSTMPTGITKRDHYEVPSNASSPATYAGILSTVMDTNIFNDIRSLTSKTSTAMVMANPFPKDNYVQVLISVRYLNSWGWHTADFAATYYVEP